MEKLIPNCVFGILKEHNQSRESMGGARAHERGSPLYLITRTLQEQLYAHNTALPLTSFFPSINTTLSCHTGQCAPGLPTSVCTGLDPSFSGIR